MSTSCETTYRHDLLDISVVYYFRKYYKYKRAYRHEPAFIPRHSRRQKKNLKKSGADAPSALAALLDVGDDGDAGNLPLAERARRGAARLAQEAAEFLFRLDFLFSFDAARPREHAVLPRAVGHARRGDEREERNETRVVSFFFFVVAFALSFFLFL
jgi:hypothetical protein